LVAFNHEKTYRDLGYGFVEFKIIHL